MDRNIIVMEQTKTIQYDKYNIFNKFSLARIQGIKLQVYSTQDIRKRAKVVVQQSQTYNDTGLVVENGVLDLRMGVCNANQVCATCGLSYLHCKGHIGIIELPFPVYHSELLSFTKAIVKHLCMGCYKIQKFNHYSKPTKKVQCAYCKQVLPIVNVSVPGGLLLNGVPIYADALEQIFKKVSISEVQNLHTTFRQYDPQYGILNVLVVGNTLMRPSLILQTNKTSESDLTHKYADIIRTISKYKKTNLKTLLDSTKTHFVNLLQYHVTTLFNNNTSGIPPAQHRSGKPLVSIVQRIKGKSGRFRKHLAGKRINFAARAVITPCINLNLDEIGFPESVARKITKPWYINKFNLTEALQLYNNGQILYISRYGRRVKVLETNKQVLLQQIKPGCLVYRTLLDGDNILMNRNPTLLPQSMLGFKIKITSGATFQLHPSVCIGFNADADGDEMNAHILQTEQAEVQCELILNVNKNVILLKTGYVILGATKDTLAGLYKLTTINVPITSYEILLLTNELKLSINTRETARKLMQMSKNGQTVTGKNIFELIIPKDLSVEIKTSNFTVVIEEGKLVNGYINKSLVGSEGILNNVIYAQYGEQIFIDYITNLCTLGTKSAQYYGITYTLKQLIELKLKNIPDDPHELKQNSLALQAEFTKNLKLHQDFNVYSIANSGASGNLYTLILTILYTGRQNDNNCSKFDSMDFSRHKLLKSDFINKGILQGLDTMEYYSAAITARAALIDVFCKTATVGYASRKILNSLEDYTIRKDGTVRNSCNKILMLKYADHGLDLNKINLHHPWVNLAQYIPEIKQKAKVENTEIDFILSELKNTHILEKVPVLLLQGMIRYLLANKHDCLTFLLQFSDYDKLISEYSLPAGLPIGLLSGQSFAEPITQLNLNTKHNIGDSTLGSAVDKLLQLLYHTKIPTTPFIKLTTAIENIELVEKIVNQTIQLKLKTIADTHIDLVNKTYTIRFMKQLSQYGLSVESVVNQINGPAYKIPLALDILEYNSERILLKLPNTFSEICALNYSMRELAVRGVEKVYGEQVNNIKTVQLTLYNISVRKFSKIISQFEFQYTLRSNQIAALYTTYGVLTAAYYLKQEIKYTFKTQGLKLLDEHIDFIVRVMSISGTIKGLSRSGVIADKASFLAKAGFETANKVIMSSAVKSETDSLNGLYENTMLAKYIRAGCNTNRLYIL